jgi:hypothetical protein
MLYNPWVLKKSVLKCVFVVVFLNRASGLSTLNCLQVKSVIAVLSRAELLDSILH